MPGDDAISTAPSAAARSEQEPASRRRLADRMLLRAPVRETERIAARMTRIRMDTSGLAMPAWVPGQQVRVVVGDAAGPRNWITGELRTYSVWDCAGGHLDLAVLDHGDGPGARWARQARPGQLVAFTRPQGNLVARPSGSHLLIGEETAAVAFGAILRALPAGQQALAILEVSEPGDQLPLPGDVHWHYRQERSAASSASLASAVAAASLPEPGTAYLAGEARTIQALRSHLTRDRGWPRRAVITKPFWTPGKKGLE
jgi:NADPH-dependent ferric siderophore reductase